MAVSVSVCEIFSVKERCDLENMVRVRSRSLEMAPFDRSHASSYSPSMVTMTLSCIICEILRVIGPKSRNFYTPPVFSAPAGGDAVGISWRCLLLIKLEWLGYRMVKKLWQYVKPFSYNTGTQRTDRQICYIIKNCGVHYSSLPLPTGVIRKQKLPNWCTWASSRETCPSAPTACWRRQWLLYIAYPA